MIGQIIDKSSGGSYSVQSYLSQCFPTSEFREYAFAKDAIQEAAKLHPHLVIIRDYPNGCMRAFEVAHEFSRRGIPKPYFVALRDPFFQAQRSPEQQAVIYWEFGINAWRYTPLHHSDLRHWGSEGLALEEKRNRMQSQKGGAE